MNTLWKRLRSYWRQRASVPLFAAEGQQDPYPLYKELREFAPVHCLKDRKYWMVSRYEDVEHVLSHSDTYLSSNLGGIETTLLAADGPEPARVRGIVAKTFTAQRVASLEGRARELAREYIDRMAEKRDCEFMGDFAKLLPMKMISIVLDLDPERSPEYTRWAEAALVDETECPDEAARQKRLRGLAELQSFLENHLQECRDGRRQGAFSRDVIPELNDHEAVDVLKLLLVAGYITTAGLAGNVLKFLLEHPDMMEALRRDPALIPVAIEETLRYNSPALSVARRPREDVTLGGQRVPADAVMFLLLGSANHQEEKFPDPTRFSLERGGKGHLSFGKGAHYCLGAGLSRMEVRVMLETLLERFERIEAAEPLDQIEWERNIHLRCPFALNVRVVPKD